MNNLDKYKIKTISLISSLAILASPFIDDYQSFSQTKNEKLFYGKVTKTKHVESFFGSDKYFFSVRTQEGLKVFGCNGDYESQKMSSLFDDNDSICVKVDFDGFTDKDNNFNINLEDVVSINGKKVRN